MRPENAWLPFRYPYSNWSLMLVHQNGQVAQFPPDDTNPDATDYLPVFKPIADGGFGVDKSMFFWGLGDPVKTYGCFKSSP